MLISSTLGCWSAQHLDVNQLNIRMRVSSTLGCWSAHTKDSCITCPSAAQMQFEISCPKSSPHLPSPCLVFVKTTALEVKRPSRFLRCSEPASTRYLRPWRPSFLAKLHRFCINQHINTLIHLIVVASTLGSCTFSDVCDLKVALICAWWLQSKGSARGRSTTNTTLLCQRHSFFDQMMGNYVSIYAESTVTELQASSSNLYIRLLCAHHIDFWSWRNPCFCTLGKLGSVSMLWSSIIVETWLKKDPNQRRRQFRRRKDQLSRCLVASISIVTPVWSSLKLSRRA